MSRPMMQSGYLRGKLLLAMPNMGDPRFERAVICMCEHSADGTMGVVINAPSKVTWKEVFSQLELDDDLIRERASLGKKLPRDWLAEMDDPTFQSWLEQLENER